MPSLRVRLPSGVLDLDLLRSELEVPGAFPPDALAEADDVLDSLDELTVERALG